MSLDETRANLMGVIKNYTLAVERYNALKSTLDKVLLLHFPGGIEEYERFLTKFEAERRAEIAKKPRRINYDLQDVDPLKDLYFQTKDARSKIPLRLGNAEDALAEAVIKYPGEPLPLYHEGKMKMCVLVKEPL